MESIITKLDRRIYAAILTLSNYFDEVFLKTLSDADLLINPKSGFEEVHEKVSQLYYEYIGSLCGDVDITLKNIKDITLCFAKIDLQLYEICRKYDIEFLYTFDSSEADECCLAAYYGTRKIIALPVEYNGFPVTSVAKGAFSDNPEVEKVIVVKDVALYDTDIKVMRIGL